MSEKVVVSQLGARMHYAVPQIFASQGRLAHFYTDICVTKGWPRIFGAVPRALLPAPVKRLVGRRPDGVPAELTTVFSAFGARSAIRRLQVKDLAAETSHALWAGSSFSQMVARSGFHDAAGLYTFSGDGLEQMRAARKQGLWTVVEQMNAPRDVLDALVGQEMARFPDWVGPTKDDPHARTFANREKAEWTLADAIICPSEFVRQHVIAGGALPEKCLLVPYGVNPAFTVDRSTRVPGPLRVLTVGEVGLRKGSPYVVEAAKLVGGAAIFRMVGNVNVPNDVRQDISPHVQLRGIVPRTAVADEFRWADVFLLPSICEGSATAVYEALAAGLPVIATPNTGTVVRDGSEGFIVPVCDAPAIALAIERLARTDELRQLMSRSALQRSKEYTVGAYGRRLISALSTLRSSAGRSMGAGVSTGQDRRRPT